MEATEVKKLKLNARRIHNTLLSNNKQIRKLRLSESSFLKNQETQEKRALKEQTIEKPSGVRKALSSIKDKMMSGPMSIFDKIKELFGIILVGFLVNALPGIIRKIKKFFDENPGIINAIKETFKILGNLGYGLIQIVNSLTPKDQQKLTAERDEVDKGINSLDGELNMIDHLMTNLFNVFGAPTPQPAQPTGSAQQFAQSGGYGRYPTPQRKPTAPASSVPGIPAPSSTQQSPPPTSTNFPPTPSTAPQSNLPVQKFSKGGTVQVGKEGGKKKKVTSSGTFTRPGGTAKGKKARESVNAFEDFETNTKTSGFLLNVQDENNKSFNKLTKNLSIFGDLIRGRKDKKDDGGGGPGGGPPIEGPGGGGGLSSAEVFEGAGPERVWNFFKGKGLSDTAVAGIMGNAQQESGFNPTIAHSESLQGSPAKFIGIFQWGNKGNGDRWGRLKKWAEQNGGLNPENIDTQLRWTWHELGGSYNHVLPKLQAAKTPEQAAKIWYDDYEVASHGLTNRQQYANQFYTKYKGKVPQSVRKASQASLPALPSTNNRSGQAYGADRDDDNDGIPDRKHAGVDFDIKGNEKFYSRLGGEVINVDSQGTPPDGYGNYVDIYNKDLNLTERIAEGNLVLVKKGDVIVPGTPVAQGESGSGVIHYEIRRGRSTGFGFEGTVNPMATLSQLGLKQGDKKTNKPGTIRASSVSKNNIAPLSNIISIMKRLGESQIDVGGYRLIIDKNDLKVEDKDGGFLGLFGSDINVESRNLNLLKKLENDLKYIEIKRKERGNLQSSTNADSSVLLATVQQPYIIEIEVVRYIGGNSEYISESGGNVNMEQLMALRLV